MSISLSGIVNALSAAADAFNSGDAETAFYNLGKKLGEKKKKGEEEDKELKEYADKLKNQGNFSQEDVQYLRNIFSLAEEFAKERKPSFGKRLQNALYGVSSSLLGNPVPPEKDTNFDNALNAILGVEQGKRSQANAYVNALSAIYNNRNAREALELQFKLAQLNHFYDKLKYYWEHLDKQNEYERAQRRHEETVRLSKEEAKLRMAEMALRYLLPLFFPGEGKGGNGAPLNFAGDLFGKLYTEALEGNVPIGTGGKEGNFPIDPRKVLIKVFSDLGWIPETKQEQLPAQPPELPPPLKLPTFQYDLSNQGLPFGNYPFGSASSGSTGAPYGPVVFTGAQDSTTEQRIAKTAENMPGAFGQLLSILGLRKEPKKEPNKGGL